MDERLRWFAFRNIHRNKNADTIGGTFRNSFSDMPLPSDRDEIIVLLARAFDLAWNSYFRPGRLVAIPEDEARKALATQLIELSKEGIFDEDRLAESGLGHLLSITPEPWGHVGIERASAKFVRLWRARIDRV